MIENKKHNLQPLTRVVHIPEAESTDILGFTNGDTDWYNKAAKKKIYEHLKMDISKILYPFFGKDTDEVRDILIKKLKKQVKKKAKMNRPHFGLL